ncbi:DUF4307 domain-containing protein [Dermabacter sp. p3-SID358]|uniref:DUF4307 domain-containing protein n=1 Tax=Dermabacter sp. p3-SID358 TaxID=2916114 RepID=UPI0021A85F14|nr:DUF4307 domain-containing protein [Dermabacter sp. p3-SID358]MCT1867014.1 DUF4307 domain-containing protein [Dermabacter sp. p3-SID358]
MTSHERTLQERYGVRKSPEKRRWALVGTVVVAVGFIATVIWVAFAFVSSQSIKTSTLSYTHLDDSRISVTFSVNAAPGTELDCSLEALNSVRAQVGYRVVRIPAQSERLTTHTADITTQGKAVSGVVRKCEAVQ